MDPDRPIIVGDATDPLLSAIAATLGRTAQQTDNLQACVDAFAAPDSAPQLIVVHRSNPTTSDARACEELRRRFGRRTRIVFVTSLMARYAQLEPWFVLSDAVLGEATAVDSLGRFLSHHRGESGSIGFVGHRRRVVVVSTNHEMRIMLADMCQRSGFQARPTPAWSSARGGSLAVWDVPVLDDRWKADMVRESRRRRIVALAGFVDRSLATALKLAGARACLELPCQFDDLSWALGIVADTHARSRIAHASHTAPPASHVASRTGFESTRSHGLKAGSHIE